MGTVWGFVAAVSGSAFDTVRGIEAERETLVTRIAAIDEFMDGIKVLAGRLGFVPILPEKEIDIAAPDPDAAAVLSQAVPDRHPAMESVTAVRKTLSKDEFDAGIREILADAGDPLKPTALLRRVNAKWPDAAYGIEAMRSRVRRSDGVEHGADGYKLAASRESGTPATPGESGHGDRGDPEDEPAGYRFVVPVRGPLDHWMVASGDCGCWICRNWMECRDEADRLAAAVPGHVVLGQGACACSGCAVARQARMAFLASENRRNLWCEVSWTVNDAVELKPLAQQVMDQLDVELRRPDRTDNWWAIIGGRNSVRYWIRKLAGIVTSGNIPLHWMAAEA